MTRWTFRILLSLLLGVILTIAVSWAIVLSSFDDAWRSSVQTSFQNQFVEAEPADHAFMEELLAAAGPNSECAFIATSFEQNPIVMTRRSTGLCMRQYVRERTYCIPTVPPSLPTYTRFAFTVDSGWPMPALTYQAVPMESRVRGGIQLASVNPHPYVGRAEAKALPLQPNWPGFLINTAFYGGGWLLLMMTIGFIKSRWRNGRGRCPKCRYDLRGDFETGCPECGWGREQKMSTTHPPDIIPP